VQRLESARKRSWTNRTSGNVGLGWKQARIQYEEELNWIRLFSKDVVDPGCVRPFYCPYSALTSTLYFQILATCQLTYACPSLTKRKRRNADTTLDPLHQNSQRKCRLQTYTPLPRIPKPYDSEYADRTTSAGINLDAKYSFSCSLIFNSDREVLDDPMDSKRLCMAHYHGKAFGQNS